MNSTLQNSARAGVLALTLFGCGLTELPAQQPGVVDNKIVQVQTSGPVHEGFAQPNGNQLEPDRTINKQPPPPVPEEAPAQQPQGPNTKWIDGYWAWDADRNDFTWITGTLRNMPPGMRFVPGYWQETAKGWRWVAGFYAPEGQQNPPLVPEPPPSLENGPTVSPPSTNSVYIPGNWNYNQGNFLWSPGFYTAARPGLVWNPARYQWTPNGTLLVGGYWDYPLDNRGLLFAPLVFSPPLVNTPGYAYRPNYVFNNAGLVNSLFVLPGLNRYYVGNYYNRAGYQPWATYGPNRYDALYGYYRWQNRSNPQWAANLKQNYQGVVAGRIPAPPRTLAQQMVQVSRTGNNSLRMVRPLNQLNQNVALQKTTASKKTAVQVASQQQRNLALARRTNELQQAAVRNSGSGSKNTVKALNLPKTQIRQAQFQVQKTVANTKLHVSTSNHQPAYHPPAVHRPTVVHHAPVHHAPAVHHAATAHKNGNGHHK